MYKFLKRVIYFCFVCMSVGLHVCVCAMCGQCPRRSEEGVGSPRSGVTKAVSCHVDAGNSTLSLCKSSWCLSH